MMGATPDVLNALADRVEAATESDRVLDAMICRALAEPIVTAKDHHWFESFNRWMTDGTCLLLTASLDAAALLVPEGQAWMVCDPANHDGRRSVFGYSSRCHATVDGDDEPRRYAATPALALTAACLRALAKASPATLAKGAE